jgi:hypothetical protein
MWYNVITKSKTKEIKKMKITTNIYTIYNKETCQIRQIEGTSFANACANYRLNPKNWDWAKFTTVEKEI